MKTLFHLLIICSVSVIWLACSENITENLEPSLKLPNTPFDYVDQGEIEAFTESELTNYGATLGRVLFYDKQLSLTLNTSCSSCHLQSNAFSDVTAKSLGFKGALTKRNSLSIVNLRYSSNLFWDNRANSLEELAGMPIADHIEMGLDDDKAVVSRLESTVYYPNLFKDAFGDRHITMERVKKALAQFVRSIQSFQSKFYLGRFDAYAQFSRIEIDGLNIFNQSGCQNCHNIGPQFFRHSSANIGLDMKYEDEGIYNTTKDESDRGRFKVPPLSNVALTAPYMHDGRFATLNDVLNHYSRGIKDHPNLDPRLKTGFNQGNWSYYNLSDEDTEPLQFNFTDYEKKALIAFFNTLTDERLITDEKFSDLFEYR